MQYRKFGNTGVSVSTLGFGCMRFPEIQLPDGSWQVDQEKTTEMLMEAYNQGVNYFDTAFFYCHENSEIAVGKVRRAFMKKYPEIFEMSEAEHLYRMGDYAAALEKARRIRHKSASAKVGGALFCARCAIALGDRNAARQDLNYVIENGNRLSEVDKAWKLLMNM